MIGCRLYLETAGQAQRDRADAIPAAFAGQPDGGGGTGATMACGLGNLGWARGFEAAGFALIFSATYGVVRRVDQQRIHHRAGC